MYSNPVKFNIFDYPTVPMTQRWFDHQFFQKHIDENHNKFI